MKSVRPLLFLMIAAPHARALGSGSACPARRPCRARRPSRSEPVSRGALARQRRRHELHDAAAGQRAHHESLLPASLPDHARRRRWPSLPQHDRRDVRHLRRRSRVHRRRPHLAAEGNRRRARAHGTFARDLQPWKDARRVHEHQRLGGEGQVRCVRSERRARRCAEGREAGVHDDAPRQEPAAPGRRISWRPRARRCTAARSIRACFSPTGRTWIISCCRPAPPKGCTATPASKRCTT